MISWIKQRFFSDRLPTPEVKALIRQKEIEDLLQRLDVARASMNAAKAGTEIANQRAFDLGELICELTGCHRWVADQLGYQLLVEFGWEGETAGGRDYSGIMQLGDRVLDAKV